MIQALLGHDETTARYSRVATGMIAKIESPLEGLSAPRRRRARRDTEEPPAPYRRRQWLDPIERCRTAALGGHVARCENAACGHTEIAYNSCRNRHSPKCQGAASRRWLADREAELLPVPYFHVVYTLPSELRDIAYQDKRVVYDLLMKAAAETTLAIATDPKRLGERIPPIIELAPTSNPHSTRCQPVPNCPRLRALALFGRRTAERAESLAIAGVQKPPHEATYSASHGVLEDLPVLHDNDEVLCRIFD